MSSKPGSASEKTFSFKTFFKSKSRHPKSAVPQQKIMSAPAFERSASRNSLPTIVEEEETGVEADVEDNDRGSPEESSTSQDDEGEDRSRLHVVTDDPTAMERPASSGTSSEFKGALSQLDKLVSNLEETLASANQQVNEKDEQLFECQQRTSTMQEAHMATYKAISASSAVKDKELELLRARIALLETRQHGKSQSVEMSVAAWEEKQRPDIVDGSWLRLL